MRFLAEFDAASLAETLAGRIVLSVGSHRQRDDDALVHLSRPEREEALRRLGELHLRKIDLADEVLVINPGGYVGDAGRREIAYARQAGEPVGSLEPLTPEVTRAD
ncbi:hypothetical protein [Deinococcus radiotolerans]|uniref:hypothetical protein n=1 Tax=Deinococcus radiotolerans TaxID=1309407 RepID=UPI001E58FFC8|nr:hypothetical protein [Deinococcus radiotolerans]